MSEFESAFLCGLLKKVKPAKVLEVGVCGGATTAIMLQCLEDIGKPYKMYSVDISEEFPRDRNLKIGFIGQQALDQIFIPQGMIGEHKFYLGTTMPFVIDEIKYDIDFAILDTAHVLPGEILDFLLILPYLSKNAVVVLHDVSENLRIFDDSHSQQHATGILFSSVVADKFLNFQSTGRDTLNYPNIAAFQINEYTMKYVENVFLSLILRWHYLPEDKELQAYTEKFFENYPLKIVDMFIEILKYNSTYILSELHRQGKSRDGRLV